MNGMVHRSAGPYGSYSARWRIRRTLCIVLAGGALSIGGCDRPQTLESVTKDLSRRFDAQRSVSAALRISTDVNLPDGMTRTEVTGTIETMRKGGKTLSREELKTTGLEIKTDGRSRKIENRSTSVADGQTLYTLSDTYGQPAVHKMKQDDAQDKLGGTAFFAMLIRMYELALMPDEVTDGVPCRVIVGTSRSAEPGLGEKVTYHVGKDDGVVRRCEMFTNDGKSKIIMTMSNVRLDVPLPPKRFEFQAPPDVPIIDVDEYHRIMEEQKKTQEKLEQEKKSAVESPVDAPATAEPPPANDNQSPQP